MAVVWPRTVKNLKRNLGQPWKNEGIGGGGWRRVDLILTKYHWIREEVTFLKVTIITLDNRSRGKNVI